ncbi:MAG: TetR/AcrR family transcriptional regulator [Gemmatimonadota bacterium]|nr:TetR/AcrR family transcriptional regulator [Gemmatimonadota bacterium]
MFSPTTLNQSHGTRERILTSARGLLAEGGVAACSMRAVADRAGITPGAIYGHFVNKESLVQNVVDETLRDFERSLLGAIVSLPVGSFARISALGDAYVRFATEHEEEFRVLFMPVAGPRRKLSEIPGKIGYRILHQAVSEAIESGEIVHTNVDLVALYLWSRVHGVVTLMLACDVSGELASGEPRDAQSLLNLTKELVVFGLQGRPRG